MVIGELIRIGWLKTRIVKFDVWLIFIFKYDSFLSCLLEHCCVDILFDLLHCPIYIWCRYNFIFFGFFSLFQTQTESVIKWNIFYLHYIGFWVEIEGMNNQRYQVDIFWLSSWKSPCTSLLCDGDVRRELFDNNFTIDGDKSTIKWLKEQDCELQVTFKWNEGASTSSKFNNHMFIHNYHFYFVKRK